VCGSGGPSAVLLVSLLGWQALFAANVPLALLALIVVHRRRRPIPDANPGNILRCRNRC
jgi:predicted MFS family arabinose efflux permease